MAIHHNESKRIALYARVSTNKHICRSCRTQFREEEGNQESDCPKCHSRDIERSQTPETQLLSLRQYAESRGASQVIEYIDRESSGKTRPQLEAMLADARKRRFDAVVIVRFDRFACSTKELILALEEFKALHIDFVSLNESIDTSTPMGKFFFTVVAAFGELERSIIQERVRAGLERARSQGKRIGRPRRIVDKERVCRLYAEHRSLRIVSKLCGVARGGTVATIVNTAKSVEQTGGQL